MTKKLPDHFWDYRKETKGQYPALDKADAEHNVVRDKLSEVKNKVENLTQYSNTHDAALGILNEIKTDFMCRGGQGELRAGLAGLGVFFKDNIYYNTGNPVMWWWWSRWSGGVVSKKRPRYY